MKAQGGCMDLTGKRKQILQVDWGVGANENRRDPGGKWDGNGGNDIKT